MEIVVQRYGLANPVWVPATPASPGEQVTLRVSAPDLTPQQYIEFRIMAGAELVEVVQSAAGQRSAQWTVPNLPGANNVTFTAIRRQAPSPANGHQTAVATIVSPQLQVHGFTAQLTSIDAAFVPIQENLRVVFTVANPGNVPLNGRYEIWGERYPGDNPQPLYTAIFGPTPNVTWNTWNGRANAGLLAGQPLTPEFSPYRLRIWIGPTQPLVDDPRGAGLGLVSCVETQFEVKFASVEIRLQAGVVEAANAPATANYQLVEALVIAPLGANGNYAATNRLPTFAPLETMRLRIPVALHQGKKDPLNQDRGAAPFYSIGTDYMTGGKKTKFQNDRKLYSRPEIPLEFIPKLTSQNPGANPQGLLQPDAVGAAIIEPIAEEYIDPTVLAAGGPHQRYLRNAAFKVKKGDHQTPQHNANNNPEYHYWTARFEVVNHGERDFNITTFDNSLSYRTGQKELTVYLNRALLTLSDRLDDNDLDIKKYDYREVTGGAGGATQIRLRANLTKPGDILWIMRTDSTAGGDDVVDRWNKFPPGPNCHLHYGGVRGEEPSSKLSNYFRAGYSKRKKGRKPIIGLATAAFPYNKYVKLKPDKADQKLQERVETTAMPAPKLGMAGVLFSPSYIAGDSYIIWARVEREAYRRRFGFVEEDPALRDQRSGIISVWRWARIGDSLRLPDIAAGGLAAGVGRDPEVAPAYAANGQNMTLIGLGNALALSTVFEPAFHDWSKIAPVGHTNINLATYRGAHNNATSSWNGNFTMNTDADVKNYSVAWDFYRAQLPYGLPALLPNLIANTIAAQPAGRSSKEVGEAVELAITNHGANPDVGLNGGVAAIPPTALGSVAEYTKWFDRRWDRAQADILDVLIPRVNNPDHVNVVRWPTLHEHDAWNEWDAVNNVASFNGMMTLGFSSGGAQSMFRTADVAHGSPRLAVAENTFPHEMGHSLNLAHFVAENFAWKHHDVNHPNCLMSYTYTTGFILQPGAAVGAGPTPETGFPHVVPAVAFPSPATGATAANAGNQCIQFGPNLNPVTLCAKCTLKLRGWNDELLPFAWLHPDLF